MKFHTVIIIFNPNSTGDSEYNAKDLKKKLVAAGYDGTVELVGTKFAGHAEEITEQRGEDEGVLVVSSSGDGGYGEVVNGILQSGGKAAVAVLPSGNANDHAVTLGTDDFITNIVSGTTKSIDCILVSSKVNGKQWKRYAHSYVGFGMSPAVGKLLTEKRPGVLMEKWYVLRHIFSFKHTTLMRDGKRVRYANLVIATIPKMSKIVKLDEGSSVTDGKMEVYETKYISRFKLVFTLIGIGLNGVSSEMSTTGLSVRTLRQTLVQLDGEVTRLDADVDVRLECKKRQLRTVL